MTGVLSSAPILNRPAARDKKQLSAHPQNTSTAECCLMTMVERQIARVTAREIPFITRLFPKLRDLQITRWIAAVLET